MPSTHPGARKPPSSESIHRARQMLQAEVTTRLTRLHWSLDETWGKSSLSEVEHLALDLEIEEEQLRDWRSNIQRLREKFQR